MAEEIEVDEGAVATIARSASGSFRDALGTLDQLVAYGGNKVGLEDVLQLLGAADAELLFGAVDAVIAEDPKAVLLGVEEMARSGRDPSQFARDLLAHLRHLLVTQTVGEVPNTFVVTATDERSAGGASSGDRRGHPGADDRRALGGSHRRPRGRRRAHGSGDRAAESSAPGPRSLHRGTSSDASRDSSRGRKRRQPRVLSQGKGGLADSPVRTPPPPAPPAGEAPIRVEARDPSCPTELREEARRHGEKPRAGREPEAPACELGSWSRSFASGPPCSIS